MLIPRYTIRWLLGLTTLSAGVSLVLAHAMRGSAWAIGVSSALWTLVVVALFFIVAFLCAWLIDQTAAGRRSDRGAGISPFADPSSGEKPFPASAARATDTPPAMTG